MPCLIEGYVLRQGCEWLRIDIPSVSMIFQMDFGPVLIVVLFICYFINASC